MTVARTLPADPWPSLGAFARVYARQGWRVLPLRRRGKKPLTCHGVKDATTDLSRLRDWWSRWPDANIGLAIPAQILVVDCDSPEALDPLRAEGLVLPATVRATTGRGLHLWYSTPGTSVRNRVGLFPSIDIRAPGGYVVAPPSLHSSGAVYRWEVELAASALSPCPAWLLERLQPTRAQGRRWSGESWYRRIAEPVSRGGRNQALAQVTGLLFRYLPAGVAAELALCWARVKLSPPLPEREVRRTIESIAGRELRRRGGAA